jgi:hypothetical protein
VLFRLPKAAVLQDLNILSKQRKEMVEEDKDVFSLSEGIIDVLTLNFVSIIYVTGIVLNAFVLLVILKDKILRENSTNHFIVAISTMELAISNVFALIFVVSSLISTKLSTLVL